MKLYVQKIQIFQSLNNLIRKHLAVFFPDNRKFIRNNFKLCSAFFYFSFCSPEILLISVKIFQFLFLVAAVCVDCLD